MSEANKELVKRWFEEVWNQGRKETIRELLAPDTVFNPGGQETIGAEGFYRFFDRMQAAFSDIHVIVHDAISEGDKVCVRWSVSMRHTGHGIGVSPTNKHVQTTGITVARIADQKFVAVWQNWDMLGLIQQINHEATVPTFIAVAKSEQDNVKQPGVGATIMGMIQLPEQWANTAREFSDKLSARGWKEIRIGLPDFSNWPWASMFADATSPSGEQFLCVVSQDDIGFQTLNQFFDSK